MLEETTAEISESAQVSRKLCLGTVDKLMKNLWGRIRAQTNACDVVAGICYRPPAQEDEVDETLFRQVEVLHSWL